MMTPKQNRATGLKQWQSTWSVHQWQLHISTFQMPWSDHYMKQKWEMSYILHYMIHFHHQPTFWVLPSLVILTHLEHTTIQQVQLVHEQPVLTGIVPYMPILPCCFTMSLFFHSAIHLQTMPFILCYTKIQSS